MIITITGYPGSGKSTLGKGIAKALGLKHYSAGDFLREIAKERGVSLMQLHKDMEKDKSVDDAIDKRNIRLGREEDQFVIDSRLAWHFIPKSIKMFVKVDLAKAAERIFKDKRHGEDENVSVAKTEQNMRRRMQMNQARYKRLYGIDYLDESNYDIVVDTTESGIDETREIVLKKIRELSKE